MGRRQTAFALSLIATLDVTSAALAQDQGDLARAAQNPVAAMISLPFQNNTFFGVGPDDDVANALNFQPVIPFTVGDWSIINRTIVPLIYLPDVTSGLPELPAGVEKGDTFGLGDINTSFYFSPAEHRQDEMSRRRRMEHPPARRVMRSGRGRTTTATHRLTQTTT